MPTNTTHLVFENPGQFDGRLLLRVFIGPQHTTADVRDLAEQFISPAYTIQQVVIIPLTPSEVAEDRNRFAQGNQTKLNPGNSFGEESIQDWETATYIKFPERLVLP